jgi:hypothetical protein
MLAAGTLSPIEMSAFFHEKLFDPQSSFPDENGFFTYQNSGLTMKYPSDWQKIDPKARNDRRTRLDCIRTNGRWRDFYCKSSTCRDIVRVIGI